MKSKWFLGVALIFALSFQSALYCADWSLYKKGVELAKKGQNGNALRVWMKLFKSRSQLNKAQQLRLSVAMARIYLRLGKKGKASKLVGYAEKIAPNNKTVLALRKKVGVNFEKAYSTALEDLDTAMLNERVSPGSGVDLLKASMPVFEEAVEKKKDDPRAHFGLALCMKFVKSDDGATEKALLKCVELDNSHLDAWARLGELYGRTGKPNKEYDCYRRCVDGGKATGPIYASLARNLANRGVSGSDMDEMVKYVNGAVKDDPTYGDGIADLITNVSVKSRVAAIVREAHKNFERRRKAQERRYSSSSGGYRGGGSSSRTVVIPKMDGKTKASPKKRR